MAKRYSDAIRIRETKSAYNIQTEESNEWKNFIPNEQFNEILQKVIGSVSNKVVDEHRSFWLEGTYGTGKSHAAAVIKHLLCDPIQEIEDYIETIPFSEIRQIFRYRYLDNKNWVQIAHEMNNLYKKKEYTENSVRHKHDRYLEKK